GIVNKKVQDALINAALLLAGVLLFALGFPSFIADWGLAPFAWISLIPVVLLIRRIPWWSSPLWGAVYGYAAYTLFNFWLATFNPVGFVLVPGIYAVWFFMLFPLLFLADRAFPRYGWAAQLMVWLAFEVMRTKGFLGYSYGIIGYSQYGWRSLIAIADIFGVLGVSLLVAWPSFMIGGWLLERNLFPWKHGEKSAVQNMPGRLFPRRWAVPAGIWAVLMLAANIYGVVSKVDYSDSPTWRPALIQHNVNTWLSGMDAWETALDSLLEESQAALNDKDGKPDAIIWSETAFVPAIEWHLKYRRERAKVNLIHRFQDFAENLDIPLIMGNNDAVMDAGKRREYNAVLLFDGKDIVDKYRKLHLVPFGEHFPYADIFPRLMKYIQSQGTPLYHKGTEYRVFNLPETGSGPQGRGPKVSPLICFEDTFGYLARNFIREGAEVLVNVSNDSWSPEPACSIQHQNMAVFRAVENRRSMVRATTAGLTCVIDPNGRTLARLEPFTKGYLIAEVPVYSGRQTLYNRYGDWFEKVLVLLGLVTVLGGAVLLLMRRTKNN
ncbi:MAG: apolipoprotein N-acyltransferase, partial [Spirochaetales bacterium]